MKKEQPRYLDSELEAVVVETESNDENVPGHPVAVIRTSEIECSAGYQVRLVFCKDAY